MKKSRFHSHIHHDCFSAGKFTLFALATCAAATFIFSGFELTAQNRPGSPPAPAVSVMTFNVENLFDTKHDRGKNDWAFMPLAQKGTPRHERACRRQGWFASMCRKLDWTEERLRLKMKRLACAVLAYNGGRGPDVLVMQEVENLAVLKTFNSRYLAGAGYRTEVLIEGPDRRGIDMAILSRLELAEAPRLYRIPYSPRRKSRGILRADLLLPGGEVLTVLGFHFPSQGSRTKSRMQALNFLNELGRSFSPRRYVVAAGDCNITKKDEEFTPLLNSRQTREVWGISHQMKKLEFAGTSYYPRKKEWSYFDVLLFSKNLVKPGGAGWRVVPSSITISAGCDRQVTRTGRPRRFKRPRFTGVSDHLPVAAVIRRTR